MRQPKRNRRKISDYRDTVRRHFQGVRVALESHFRVFCVNLRLSMIVDKITVPDITLVVQALISEWQDANAWDRCPRERVKLLVPAWRVVYAAVRYT